MAADDFLSLEQLRAEDSATDYSADEDEDREGLAGGGAPGWSAGEAAADGGREGQGRGPAGDWAWLDVPRSTLPLPTEAEVAQLTEAMARLETLAGPGDDATLGASAAGAAGAAGAADAASAEAQGEQPESIPIPAALEPPRRKQQQEQELDAQNEQQSAGDSAFLDAGEDQSNAAFVTKELRGGRSGGSDALLSCPGCFTAVAFDCVAAGDTLYLSTAPPHCNVEPGTGTARCRECATRVGARQADGSVLFDDVLPSAI